MKVRIERNVRFGRGCQIRFTETVDGEERETLLDSKPYTSLGAAYVARRALEIYNRDHGTDYKLPEVLTKD